MWHKIFARSKFCDFCNFFNNQQKYVAAKKISCEHFPTKINFTPEQIFSNLNSLHKNTAVHIRNCVDLCLLSIGKEKSFVYRFYLGYAHRKYCLKICISIAGTQ